jgi:hypothetical protein
MLSLRVSGTKCRPECFDLKDIGSADSGMMSSLIICKFQQLLLVLRVIKLYKVRFAGYVADVKKLEMHIKLYSRKLKGRRHLRDLEVDGQY